MTRLSGHHLTGAGRHHWGITDWRTAHHDLRSPAAGPSAWPVSRKICLSRFETDQYNNYYPMTELPGTRLPRLRPAVPWTVSVTRGAAATDWPAKIMSSPSASSQLLWSLLTSRGGWALVDYFCVRSTHCGGLVESVKAKFNLIQGVGVTEAASLFTSVLTQSDSPVQYWITHWLAGLAVQLVSVVEPGLRPRPPGPVESGEGSPRRIVYTLV